MQQTQIPTIDRADARAAALSCAVDESVRTPLAVVRAALESLARTLERDDPRCRTLERALAEVIHVGRSVQALIDYALPRPVKPLGCTAEELAHSALEPLTPEQRSRVLLAVEGGGAKLHVDGPIFSRAMSRLLEHALCVSGETVLLWARGAEGETTFGILHELSPAIGPRDPRLGTAELGCELARRDLERLGATFARRRTDASQSRTEVRYSTGRSPRERA